MLQDSPDSSRIFLKLVLNRIGFNHTSTSGHCRIERIVDEVRADDMISTLSDYLLQNHAKGITAKGKRYCDLSPGFYLFNV